MPSSTTKVLIVTLLLGLSAACSSIPVVDPQTLRSAQSTSGHLVLKNGLAAYRQELPGVSYQLPAGPYIPLGGNENGVFYECESGIVIKDTRKIYAKAVTYSLYRGGIYVPNDPKLDVGIWNLVDANISGELNVSEDAALRFSERCDTRGNKSRTASSGGDNSANIVVSVIPTGPGANKVNFASQVGTNVAASVAVNAIGSAVLSIGKGNIMIPPIRVEGESPMRDLIKITSD